MSTVCITGYGGPALEQAASLLHLAGMAQARSTEHARAITVEQWHEQILARSGEEATALQSPGRMWEQLAADLLVANLDFPCWGWASALSVPLLEFWSSFDPQIRFVLVCEPLDRMVAQQICEGRSTKDLQALIAQWHQTHETMLRFHLRHQQTSMLVWGHTLASQGKEHLKNWTAAWQLRLSPVQEHASLAAHEAHTASPNALLAYLTEKLVAQYPASVALSEELLASVWASELAELHNHLSQPDVDTLVGALQVLQAEAIAHAVRKEQARAEARLEQRLNEVQQQATQQQALQQENFDQRYAQQLQAAELSQTKLQQVKEELTRAAKSLSELSAERDALALDKSKSDAALKDATAENELLLTQLHQVQEELERQFVAGQELKATLEVQTKTTATLKAERDALNQDKVTLTKARDTELKANQAAQAERDKLVADKTKSDAALRDAEAENELLLTQLHQVQEELERQFLDNQANKLQLHQAKASISRVMASFPGTFDCESLHLVSGGDDNAPWRWQAKNLCVAGHQVQQLDFETPIEQGVAGIAIHKSDGMPEPMLRWPLSAKGKNATLLIPLHKEKDEVNRLAVLAQLSASDWDMTQALNQLVVRQLAQGKLDVPVAKQMEMLQASLRSRELMQQLQEILRFDSVILEGHQAIETREVLSFKFTNLSHRRERLRDFKFQLQAQPLSAGADGQLGGTVHVIVARDTAAAPFEPWISNAADGTGLPVMAISLTERGPLAGTWERLSVGNRAFVAALIDALPLALALLSDQGKKLPRPWKDWIELVKKIRQWVRLPQALEPAQPAMPETTQELPAPAKRQRSLRLTPVSPQPAKKAAASKNPIKIAPPSKSATKKAPVPQARALSKKPAAHRKARTPLSARAGK